MFKRIKHWWNGSNESIENRDGEIYRCVTLPDKFNQPWIRRFFRTHKKIFFTLIGAIFSAFIATALYFKDTINQVIITLYL